jgi:hypothetical protein
MRCLRRSGGPAIQPCIAPSEASTALDRVRGRAWSVNGTAGTGRVLWADRRAQPGGSSGRFDSAWSSPSDARHLVRQALPCVLRCLVIDALREIRHMCHGELLDSSSSIERLFEVLQANSPESSQMLFSDPPAEPEIVFLYLVGDSGLVRLGGPDAWVVIDSCVEPPHKAQSNSRLSRPNRRGHLQFCQAGSGNADPRRSHNWYIRHIPPCRVHFFVCGSFHCNER